MVMAMASAGNPGSRKFSIKLSAFRICRLSADYLPTDRVTHPRPVRRFFLIFLLLVLPFQFAWSAAVPYCQHEQQPARSWHLGHHEHQHEAKKKQDAKTLVDADCDYCHVASTPLASIAQSGMTLHERVPMSMPSIDRKIRSHVPEAPERPNWSRLA